MKFAFYSPSESMDVVGICCLVTSTNSSFRSIYFSFIASDSKRLGFDRYMQMIFKKTEDFSPLNNLISAARKFSSL